MVESRYWLWTAKETAELRTEELADPGPHQVLVRSRYTAVSPGTEMALFMMTHVGFADPSNRYARYPHRPGYLNAGVVVEAGRNAAGAFAAGTRVFSPSPHAEYSLVDAVDPLLLPFPENLDGPVSPLCGLLRIGSAAPFMAPSAPGESVAVIGGGLVGNFAAQLYKAAGAEVVLVEKDDFRRAIAGACELETLTSLAELPARFVGGPRIVVEATGVPRLCVEAMKAAAPRGRVVILSSPRGEALVNFYEQIHAKVLTVIGAHARCLTDDAGTLRNVMRLAAEGTLKLAPCLTHVESWDQAPKVWSTYAAGAPGRLGTVLDWTR